MLIVSQLRLRIKVLILQLIPREKFPAGWSLSVALAHHGGRSPPYKNPQSPPAIDVGDLDSDGLGTLAEVNIHGTDPRDDDSDDDGLSDYVEVTVYGRNPALRDSDGDGFEDLFVVNTGFDPASDTSTPEAYSEMLIAVEFRFNAAAGVTYKVESSTDLDTWDLVESGIAGGGATITRFIVINNDVFPAISPCHHVVNCPRILDALFSPH
jgi:hypothetical protein